MSLFKNKYRIKSIRVPGYDYSQTGIYFVTICCYQKQHFFGKIKNNNISLSPMGKIAKQCWLEIPKHYPNIKLDEYVIMPNHIHGLIYITNNYQYANVETQHAVSLLQKSQNKFQYIIPKSLGIAVRGYKSAVTNFCHKHDFVGIVWQPNYYERIVRDEQELFYIRKYIKNNPLNWQNNINNT